MEIPNLRIFEKTFAAPRKCGICCFKPARETMDLVIGLAET